jgi:pilus assembly protein CpaD
LIRVEAAMHPKLPRWWHACAVVTLLAALAACDMNPSPQAATAADITKEIRAEPVRAVHGVTFAPGSAYMVPGELARLSGFVRSQVRPGDEVVVFAGQAGGLEQARLQSVRSALQGSGVQVIAANRASELAIGPDSVLVSATRYIARNPRCPDWSKLTNYDPNNVQHSNFGCADAVNLGTMVANPKDLAIGRDPGPVDPTRAAASIERYRRDAVRQPPVVTTGTGAGGAPAAAGGGASGTSNY